MNWLFFCHFLWYFSFLSTLDTIRLSICYLHMDHGPWTPNEIETLKELKGIRNVFLVSFSKRIAEIFNRKWSWFFSILSDIYRCCDLFKSFSYRLWIINESDEFIISFTSYFYFLCFRLWLIKLPAFCNFINKKTSNEWMKNQLPFICILWIPYYKL